MRRHLFIFAVVTAMGFPSDSVWAASGARVITRSIAAQHGLARAWFTQVRIDPARSRVTEMRLVGRTDRQPDTLFVQTDRATVHAINAETGQTLWMKMVGHPDYPTMPVGANRELVAVINGTTIYVMDRANGRLLWKARVNGVPAAGVVMSDRRAFVPMLNGQVVAYRLKKQESKEDAVKPAAKQEVAAAETVAATDEPSAEAGKQEEGKKEPGVLSLQQQYIPTLTCVSFGRITSQPIVTRQDELGEFVAWATTKGLFISRIDWKKERQFTLEYQLATATRIVSQPTFLPPATTAQSEQGILFAASENGEVHATTERKGLDIWKYAVGEPILQPVVPIEKDVYVATQRGGMFCLEAASGNKKWWTDRVTQFVAASKDRIYAADAAGDILVLDRNTGTRVDTVAAADLPLKYLNLQTDRIYLATPSGLVQCLREVGLTEPIRHRKEPVAPPDKSAKPDKPDTQAPPAEPKAPADKPAPAKKAAPADKPEPAPGDDPFAEGGDNKPAQ